MIPCFSIVRFIHGFFLCYVSLIILDSGHGGQIEDKDGDEVDGFDEGSLWLSNQTSILPCFVVIFPLDYKEAGFIVDDVCIQVFDVSGILTPV